MMGDGRDLKSLQMRVAALVRAAQTDGAEMTRPARAAFLESFETGHQCKHCKPIVIDQTMPPEQRARAVQAAISAHFSRLALASARARGRSAEADAELADNLAQLDAAE